MKNRGLYILANDRVHDLAATFLNSFRVTNPDLPVCVIPFDDADTRIRALCRQRGLRLYDDHDQLRRFDDLSLRLHGRIVGQYRKLAAWLGGFDEFIFIDTDTLALQPFDRVFDLLGEYDYIAGHSDYPHIRSWTWRDSAYAGAGLTAEQINFAANTGFFASKASGFNPAALDTAVARALQIRAHMELNAYEQSFLNLLVVTSGLRYTSLARLAAASPEADVPCECWPGDKAWSLNARHELHYAGRKKSVLFIHWAGCWWPTPFERRIERLLIKLGFRIKPADVRYRLRFKRLWRHYRDLGLATTG